MDASKDLRCSEENVSVSRNPNKMSLTYSYRNSYSSLSLKNNNTLKMLNEIFCNFDRLLPFIKTIRLYLKWQPTRIYRTIYASTCRISFLPHCNNLILISLLTIHLTSSSRSTLTIHRSLSLSLQTWNLYLFWKYFPSLSPSELDSDRTQWSSAFVF